ncbi:hypothetical protein [Candidatus Paracaedibacter symbiosus]|uniref:hypothetical protein n=1 Tax=Candidatus Paracaedibacter symbiosus TaxID=244582 RepID=UPI000509617C|nr:hypothetical protein [Candidatus Paracaedibacter symbiosus]
MAKSKSDYTKDYTDPELREKLKEKIKSESKGGKEGQWSARKSQLLKKEYEAHGGDYKHKGSLSDSQKSLKKWTEEDWQTEGGDKARRGHKTTRYLPKKVWNKLSSKEKSDTIKQKENHSLKGEQYAPNPPSVTQKVKDIHNS